jgi:hypothetical protein
MQNSSTNSCLVGIKWGWSDKLSSQQESVRLDPRKLAQVGGVEAAYPNDVLVSTLRMRGTGHALQLVFESSPGKDMVLLGHSISGITRDTPEGAKA